MLTTLSKLHQVCMKANRSSPWQPRREPGLLEMSSEENNTNTNGQTRASEQKNVHHSVCFQNTDSEAIIPSLKELKFPGMDSSVWTECENCDRPKTILLDSTQVWQQLSHLNNCTKFTGRTSSGSVSPSVKTPLESHHTSTSFYWKNWFCYLIRLGSHKLKSLRTKSFRV